MVAHKANARDGTRGCEALGLFSGLRERRSERPQRAEQGDAGGAATYAPSGVFGTYWIKWRGDYLKTANVEHNRRTAASSPGVRVDGPVGPREEE